MSSSDQKMTGTRFQKNLQFGKFKVSFRCRVLGLVDEVETADARTRNVVVARFHFFHHSSLIFHIEVVSDLIRD